jgi:hypothetical protein
VFPDASGSPVLRSGGESVVPGQMSGAMLIPRFVVGVQPLLRHVVKGRAPASSVVGSIVIGSAPVAKGDVVAGGFVEGGFRSGGGVLDRGCRVLGRGRVLGHGCILGRGCGVLRGGCILGRGGGVLRRGGGLLERRCVSQVGPVSATLVERAVMAVHLTFLGEAMRAIRAIRGGVDEGEDERDDCSESFELHVCGNGNECNVVNECGMSVGRAGTLFSKTALGGVQSVLLSVVVVVKVFYLFPVLTQNISVTSQPADSSRGGPNTPQQCFSGYNNGPSVYQPSYFCLVSTSVCKGL